MSLTPRAPSRHQLLPPPRIRRQIIKRAPSPPAAAAASPSVETPHHRFPIPDKTHNLVLPLPEDPGQQFDDSHKTQQLQIDDHLGETVDIVLPAHESCSGGSSSSNNATRVPCWSLSPISSELPFTSSNSKPGGGGSLVPICSDDREAAAHVPFERSVTRRFDGRGIVALPQDDENVSIDKLLAQWADKINKAEQEFNQEELAFERAQTRLSSAASNRSSLRSLSPPNASTRLLEKVKRIIGSGQHQNDIRLSPIKKHSHHHQHHL